MLASMLLGAAFTARAEPLGNWFNDPFFQVREALADCPLPLGPLIPKSAVRAEEHSRVERGTSCWLAGQCELPNAYAYDGAIASELARRFSEAPNFRETTLWITVKRRFVWIEGCASEPEVQTALEGLAHDVPHVQQVFVNLRTTPMAKPPYPTRDDASAPAVGPATPP